MANYQIFLYWSGNEHPVVKFICFFRDMSLADSACVLHEYFGDTISQDRVQYGIPMYLYNYLHAEGKTDEECKAYVFDTPDNAKMYLSKYLNRRKEIEYIS